jgi:hypothetical protein
MLLSGVSAGADYGLVHKWHAADATGLYLSLSLAFSIIYIYIYICICLEAPYTSSSRPHTLVA